MKRSEINNAIKWADKEIANFNKGFGQENVTVASVAVIMPDKVTIMAEVAEWPDEIDIDRAEESKSRAEKRLAEADPSIDVVRAEMSLRRALTRIEASQK